MQVPVARIESDATQISGHTTVYFHHLESRIRKPRMRTRRYTQHPCRHPIQHVKRAAPRIHRHAVRVVQAQVTYVKSFGSARFTPTIQRYPQQFRALHAVHVQHQHAVERRVKADIERLGECRTDRPEVIPQLRNNRKLVSTCYGRLANDKHFLLWGIRQTRRMTDTYVVRFDRVHASRKGRLIGIRS